MWQIEKAKHENPATNKRRTSSSACIERSSKIIAVQNAEQLVDGGERRRKASTSSEMEATCSKNGNVFARVAVFALR